MGTVRCRCGQVLEPIVSEDTVISYEPCARCLREEREATEARCWELVCRGDESDELGELFMEVTASPRSRFPGLD